MGEAGDLGAPDRGGILSYDAFLLNALGHTGRGARDVDHVPGRVLGILSAGTGVPVERLLDMTAPRIMARMFQQPREWLDTPQGHAAFGKVNAMASRRSRRMSANRGF